MAHNGGATRPRIAKKKAREKNTRRSPNRKSSKNRIKYKGNVKGIFRESEQKREEKSENYLPLSLLNFQKKFSPIGITTPRHSGKPDNSRSPKRRKHQPSRVRGNCSGYWAQTAQIL
ncbi:hypothetical protein PIB30_049697 [Stylosanthes scabra]|uniref:Uncharacterized protein n=1 Tax=Stylosanthes scabra TaxID=79078 RepID=A0ABU6YHW7_9FABA|nr:hypothetical protein [Stylosanthes scabra]